MATEPQRDAPWVMRTYSGHSTARASNELYRTNLAKGQTGLSIAFDLPTQTGYDPDAPEAAGEVGKVGVPVAHLGHMERAAGRASPSRTMNTSMTINATAAWLLGLYVAHAEDTRGRPGAPGRHHPERHRQGVPQPRHLHLPARPEPPPDRRHHRLHGAPRAQVEPDQRLQLPPPGGRGHARAGDRLRPGHRHRRPRRRPRLGQGRPDRAARRGRPHQLLRELGRPLRRGDLQDARLHRAVGPDLPRALRGARTPSCAASATASRSTRSGLTEQQPENNVQRIVLETLGVTLSKSARARAMQLPAWNEALGLPRPWDQQWSLRIQQVLAFESDLLEYGDIFEGSMVIEAKTAELAEAAWAELADVEALGGAFEAIDELKRRLVRSQAERVRRIEIGRAEGGRGELLHRDGALPPPRRRRDREHPARSTTASRPSRSRTWSGWRARARRRRRAAGDRRAAPRGPRRRPRGQRHGGHHRPRPRRRDDRGVGGRPARGLRRVPRPHRGRRRGGRAPRGAGAGAGPHPGPGRRAPAARRASWWPSRGSTATPTAPSRSRWRPATPGSR